MWAGPLVRYVVFLCSWNHVIHTSHKPHVENHLEDLWWKSEFKTMMCITRCAYMVQSAIFELYWTTISSKVINKIRKEKLFVCVTPVAPNLELYFIKIIFKIDNEVPRVNYVVAHYFWVVGCILCHILYLFYRYWSTTHHQGALSFCSIMGAPRSVFF